MSSDDMVTNYDLPVIVTGYKIKKVGQKWLKSWILKSILEDFECPLTLLGIRLIPFNHGQFFGASLGLQNEPLPVSIGWV